MKEILILNPENVTDEELSTYETREASRAVVIDSDNKIAILYVSNHHYYKLPGGGIEEGEDKKLALERECLEEIGCEVEVVGELGLVVEYKRIHKLKQTSHCYVARVKGEKKEPSFTEFEISGGFKALWMPYSDIEKLVFKAETEDTWGREYVIPRDTCIIKEAKNKGFIK